MFDFVACCRLCLKKNVNNLVNCLDIKELRDAVRNIFGFEITESDDCSTKLCRDCIYKVTNFSMFRDSVLSNQKSIEQYKALQTKILHMRNVVKTEDGEEDDVVFISSEPGISSHSVGILNGHVGKKDSNTSEIKPVPSAFPILKPKTFPMLPPTMLPMLPPTKLPMLPPTTLPTFPATNLPIINREPPQKKIKLSARKSTTGLPTDWQPKPKIITKKLKVVCKQLTNEQVKDVYLTKQDRRILKVHGKKKKYKKSAQKLKFKEQQPHRIKLNKFVKKIGNNVQTISDEDDKPLANIKNSITSTVKNENSKQLQKKYEAANNIRNCLREILKDHCSENKQNKDGNSQILTNISGGVNQTPVVIANGLLTPQSTGTALSKGAQFKFKFTASQLKPSDIRPQQQQQQLLPTTSSIAFTSIPHKMLQSDTQNHQQQHQQQPQQQQQQPQQQQQQQHIQIRPFQQVVKLTPVKILQKPPLTDQQTIRNHPSNVSTVSLPTSNNIVLARIPMDIPESSGSMSVQNFPRIKAVHAGYELSRGGVSSNSSHKSNKSKNNKLPTIQHSPIVSSASASTSTSMIPSTSQGTVQHVIYNNGQCIIEEYIPVEMFMAQQRQETKEQQKIQQQQLQLQNQQQQQIHHQQLRQLQQQQQQQHHNQHQQQQQQQLQMNQQLIQQQHQHLLQQQYQQQIKQHQQHLQKQKHQEQQQQLDQQQQIQIGTIVETIATQTNDPKLKILTVNEVNMKADSTVPTCENSKLPIRITLVKVREELQIKLTDSLKNEIHYNSLTQQEISSVRNSLLQSPSVTKLEEALNTCKPCPYSDRLLKAIGILPRDPSSNNNINNNDDINNDINIDVNNVVNIDENELNF